MNLPATTVNAEVTLSNAGFETGTASPWSGGGGTFTVQSDQKHSGTYALKVEGQAWGPYFAHTKYRYSQTLNTNCQLGYTLPGVTPA